MSKIYTYNEKLKYARELRGWSQEELARRIGYLAESMDRPGVVLDVSTISRWERGRNAPSHFYRQLLCTLFEMNAEELGLLSTEELSPAAEATLPLQRYNARESLFGEQIGPIVETDGLDKARVVRKDSERRVIPAVKPVAPYLHFIQRRKLLLTLLTGAAVGGTALTVGLYQSHLLPFLSPLRRWPELTPDSHEQLASVRVLQWMLNAHGWSLHVNGVFWVNTENALMFFQENANIPVTTTVTGTTWEQLILPSRRTADESLYQGAKVKALQEILNSYNVASPKLDVDGEFGPLTEAATKHFQQIRNLPVTGVADLNTWCVLVGGHLE